MESPERARMRLARLNLSSTHSPYAQSQMTPYDRKRPSSARRSARGSSRTARGQQQQHVVSTPPQQQQQQQRRPSSAAPPSRRPVPDPAAFGYAPPPALPEWTPLLSLPAQPYVSQSAGPTPVRPALARPASARPSYSVSQPPHPPPSAPWTARAPPPRASPNRYRPHSARTATRAPVHESPSHTYELHRPHHTTGDHPSERYSLSQSMHAYDAAPTTTAFHPLLSTQPNPNHLRQMRLLNSLLEVQPHDWSMHAASHCDTSPPREARFELVAAIPTVEEDELDSVSWAPAPPLPVPPVTTAPTPPQPLSAAAAEDMFGIGNAARDRVRASARKSARPPTSAQMPWDVIPAPPPPPPAVLVMPPVSISDSSSSFSPSPMVDLHDAGTPVPEGVGDLSTSSLGALAFQVDWAHELRLATSDVLSSHASTRDGTPAALSPVGLQYRQQEEQTLAQQEQLAIMSHLQSPAAAAAAAAPPPTAAAIAASHLLDARDPVCVQPRRERDRRQSGQLMDASFGSPSASAVGTPAAVTSPRLASSRLIASVIPAPSSSSAASSAAPLFVAHEPPSPPRSPYHSKRSSKRSSSTRSVREPPPPPLPTLAGDPPPLSPPLEQRRKHILEAAGTAGVTNSNKKKKKQNHNSSKSAASAAPSVSPAAAPPSEPLFNIRPFSARRRIPNLWK